MLAFCHIFQLLWFCHIFWYFRNLLRSCCFRLSRRPAIREAANMIMMKIITSDNNDSPFGRARSFGLFINWWFGTIWKWCLTHFKVGEHWAFVTISQFESHFLLDSQIDNASTGSRSQNIKIMHNYLKVDWQLNIGLTIEHTHDICQIVYTSRLLDLSYFTQKCVICDKTAWDIRKEVHPSRIIFLSILHG